MAATRRRPGSKLTSAERILERAIEVIEKGGEAAIRTNTIAGECGVTPPILYRAFGSREGLVVAAQAERYRRSSALAAEYLISRIETASSRAQLRANVEDALGFIFIPERAAGRRLRAEVIGSAVPRPALRDALVRIDTEYADRIAEAYTVAVDKGWIDRKVDLRAIALWAQGLVTSKVGTEFGQPQPLVEEWVRLSTAAVLRAIFGD